MNKREEIIATTVALYRVTELMPETEPLRLKIRELGNEILEKLFLGDKKGAKTKINLLLLYFDVALKQSRVKEKNFLVLRRKYKEIETNLVVEKIAKRPQIRPKQINNSFNSKKSRQQKILELMKANQGKIDLEQIREQFSNVSARTLRRDMSLLAKKDLVSRIRKSKKDVIFILKNNADN